MDKQQPKSRRTANQAFLNSLHDLETALQAEDDTQPNSHPPSQPLHHPPSDHADHADLELLLDEAVKDIEQFMADDHFGDE